MTRARAHLLAGIVLGLVGAVGSSAQTATPSPVPATPSPVPATPQSTPATPRPTPEQISQHLAQAGIVKTEEGPGGALRVTLADGTLTYQGWFQAIDAAYPGIPRESYHFNLAARGIADLVGVGEVVPPVVERTLAGQPGALSWWDEGIAMTEAERRQSEAASPDLDGWTASIYRMRILTALVNDQGRDLSTVLITRDWKPLLIDFTRAFVPQDTLPTDISLLRCDRAVLDKVKAFTRQDLEKAVGDHLTPKERDAVMKRRDRLVKHFKDLVGKRGEDAVLY